MAKINYIALGAAGLAAISVFLPWVEASSSASFGGYSASYSSGGISGISIGGGIFGLLVALAGGFMAFKNIKFAFIAGAINFLNGLGYMLGWFGAGGSGSYSSSFGSGSARASVDPQVGLYLFVLASLVFVIFTLKNLKGEKTKSMFKNPFSFKGRIRRTEYGLSFIIIAIAMAITLFIVIGTAVGIAVGTKNSSNMSGFFVLQYIFYIPILWFLLAQGAKRCHDVGKNGWWQIIPFYSIYLIFGEGIKGENEYGEDPKKVSSETSNF